MFGLGYQELLIILVIVLILFGANRLPELARSLGSSVKEFKKGVNEVKDERHDGRREEGRREEGLAPLALQSLRHPTLARAYTPQSPCVRAPPRRLRAWRWDSPSLTLLSRWPYRARMLYNWDAVQFALALARVRRRQAPAPSAGLHPLRRAGPAASTRWLGDPTLAYVALADALQRPARPSSSTCWRARLYDRPPRSPPARCSR